MANLVHVEGGGPSLKDVLFERAVEFPCGGVSLCGRCRVRVVEGDVPITAGMDEVLTAEELAVGWRLGCLAQAFGGVTLEIGQWETPILTDNTAVAFEPAEGYGAVVDIGTTTLVAQLLNLRTGAVEDVRTALNPQSVYGADLMSRIGFDLGEPGVLMRSIRSVVNEMLTGWSPREVLLAGNTVMHHLYGGLNVESLSHVPFETTTSMAIQHDGAFMFLPCIGGFVGSDILAGILAVGMQESERTLVLVDLGTNGEIAIGSRHGIVCASTAAGPAFEAGNIRHGMRAATGAISAVEPGGNGTMKCSVIGGGEARGICGSGLVDAVACALDAGLIAASGRLLRPLALDGIPIAQSDIRELQLAKGAIAAGLRILGADRAGELYLAGAFGNYVSLRSARRIGLLPPIPERVTPRGNTALQGAKLLLLNPLRRQERIDSVLSRTRHVSLGSLAEFENCFVDCMAFPGV